MFPRSRDRPRNGSFHSPLSYSRRSSDYATSHGDVTFADEVEKKYICPVCLAALCEPIQTKCGHRFCKACLKNVCGSRRYLKCPVDNNWLDSQIDLFEDIAMKREVLSLDVKCPEEDCGWQGELRQLQVHESSCDHVVIVCKNECGASCKRSAITDHLLSCPQRLEICKHCNQNVAFSDLAKHQLLNCMKFPVNCAVCGETGIIRQDIPKHVDDALGNCPLVVVSCAFQFVGCNFKDKRKNMTAHHQELSQYHALLLNSKLAKADSLLQTYENRINSQNQQLNKTLENMCTLVTEMEVLRREQVVQAKKIEELTASGTKENVQDGGT